MLYGREEAEPLPEITYVKDSYITNYGTSTVSSGWYYTIAIPIHAGDKVTHKGFVGAACAAIFTKNGSSVSVKKDGSGSSIHKTYTWTANADCNVGFSGKFSSPLPKFYLNDVELVITNP